MERCELSAPCLCFCVSCMYYNLLPEGLQAKSDNLGHAIRLLPGSVGYNTGKDLYRIKTRTAPFGRKLPGSQIEKGQNRRNFSRNRDRMCYHWPVGPSAGLSPAFFSSEACPRSRREFWPQSGLWASLGSPQTDQGQAGKPSRSDCFPAQ